MSYPESPSLVRLKDSDQFRPYLHSTSVRWTYGGIRGRALSDWPATLSATPVPRLLGLLGAAHIDGIALARKGYADEGRKLEAQLSAALHEQPVASVDGEFAFFALRSYDQVLASRHEASELSLVGSRVLAHTVPYPVGFSSPHPKVLLDNPSKQPVTEQLHLVVTSPTGTAIAVRWPDGMRQVVHTTPSADLSRTLSVAPGRSEVELSSRGFIGLVRLGVNDPVLEGFVP